MAVNLSELERLIAQVADQAIHDCADDLLAKSGEQVPHDMGTLELSGEVIRLDAGKYIVSYNTAYAVKQHEDLTLRHQRGRKAKYLEDPYNENAQKYKDYIAAKIAEALK
ncbi:hypothetical protein AGMMS49975_15030 [Clostridia bacterium]|nr:hypothetical protein AGMMS49975_15030 [Clostridia bacterium]